ncbi:hypothetical protein NGC85_17275 (plasmid) [Acinetobacter sp. Z1]|uniref:hypothetical protein n=1 Tax=Acinetobacter sp. Z1 TaxID=2953738 RepID=UPI0020C9A190|nr:hypothetical protein [Acinetobacter sp. Z1]UTO21244.1 hypothetical protein NGC85_17275 [Acinetobacter sp. Z1]
MMKNKFLTVVLQLPDDKNQRNAITDILGIGKELNGAVITALSQEDEISINELLEETLDFDEVNAIRAKVFNIQHGALKSVDTDSC